MEALAGGKTVLILDEVTGDRSLAVAAERVTPHLLEQLIEAGDGVVWAAMPEERLLELGLIAPGPALAAGRPLSGRGIGHRGQAGGDASLAARAKTLAILADWTSSAADFTNHGYVFPLCCDAGGVFSSPSRPEAAVDLASLAGCTPAAAICELPSRGAGRSLPPKPGTAVVSVAMVLAARRLRRPLPRKLVTTAMPLRHGIFKAVGFLDAGDGGEHLALVLGDVRGGRASPVHLHRRCPQGDVFGALECDCAARLYRSLGAIAEEGRGVLVYLCGDPSGRRLARSTGYELDVGAQILRALGLTRVRLLSDEPDEELALRRNGLEVVESMPLDAGAAWDWEREDWSRLSAHGFPAPSHAAAACDL
ncbi:MAG: 3,4-dihydroxy-2-butanone-4-phosphate synthase [Solirubrobacterales bacterium]